MDFNRGVFGWRGVIGDYRAFRRQGSTRSHALCSAIDYWRWDLANTMTWMGRPKVRG